MRLRKLKRKLNYSDDGLNGLQEALAKSSIWVLGFRGFLAKLEASTSFWGLVATVFDETLLKSMSMGFLGVVLFRRRKIKNKQSRVCGLLSVRKSSLKQHCFV